MSSYTALQTSATTATTKTSEVETTTTAASTSVRRRSSAVNIPPSAISSLEIDHHYEDINLESDAAPDTARRGSGGHGHRRKSYRILQKSHLSDDDIDDDDAPNTTSSGDDDVLGKGGGPPARHPPRRRSCLSKILPTAVASHLQDYVNVLDNYPLFKAYLMAHICQHIGDWFVRIASLLVVQELSTKGSALSNLVLSMKLPMALFAQVGGYLADRYDRRILMITMDFLAGITVLGYLFAIHYKSLPLLYTVTMLRSAIGSAYYPVTTGIVPLLVPNKHDLQYAVTMNSWAWSCMAIVGGIIAGGATAVIGLQACYILDSITYFISAAVVYYGIKGNYCVWITDSDASTVNGTSFVGRSCNAAKQLAVYLTTCGFGLLVLMKPSASFVWGPEDVIGSLFATVRDPITGEEEEGTSSVRTGLLFSVTGIGCLIGPTLMNFITDANQPRTLQRACLTGLSVLTAGWLLISLAPDFKWFLPFTLIRVMGSSIVWVYSTMLLQSMADKDILGRVLSVEYTFYTLTEAASAWVTGRLDDLGSSTHVLALFAAALGAFTVAFWGVYHWLSKGAANPNFNQPPEPSYEQPTVSTLSMELPSTLDSVAEPGGGV